MMKVLSILNSSILTSATESWLSFCSIFMDIYPKCIFLSALGLLFLCLRYLILKPVLPTQTSQGIRKRQCRAKKERRATFNEFRGIHREAQERRKLQSVVKSPHGQLYDPSYFRQMLCQDPSCDVCNGATVKVRRLLSWANLEDYSASPSSMISTASVTETSFTLSSSLSTSPSGYQISSFSATSSPPPPSILMAQDDSLPPEPTLKSSSFPLDHILPHPLTHSPSVTQPATQQAKGSLRPETIQSLTGSHGDQFLNATPSEDAWDTLLESFQQPGGAHNSFPSQSKCLVNQETSDYHTSEDFWEEQASPHFTVPENLLKILERGKGSQADVLTSTDSRGEVEPFQKALAIWEKKPESTAMLPNSEDSFPLGSSRAILNELSTLQGLAQAQTPEGQLEAVQHFWGLPYLHSESMSCVTTLSSQCSSVCIWFNRATDSPALAPPEPLPLPEPQTLTQSQSRSIQLATPQAQLQPMPALSPSSQSQVRVCGVYFRRSQETKTLLQSEIHHLEYNVMAREQALPSVVQKSQEKICLLPSKRSLAIKFSKTQTPRSVPPRDFPLTDGFQKKFEQHLRKRLILQRWGLPQGIYKFHLWASPDPPEPSVNNYGLSGFKQLDSKELPNTVSSRSGSPQERCPGSVSLDRKTVKAQGQTVEIIQKYLCSNSKSALDNGLPSDHEINLQGHSGSLSDKPSGTSQISQYWKKIETAPREHWKSHIDGTNENQVPVTMSRLGHHPLRFSSCVGKEGNGVERQSPSDNKEGQIKNMHRIIVSGVQKTPVVFDTINLEESVGKRHSPDVPKRESEGKRYSPDVPKRESEGKRYSPDVPKRESVGKRYSPDVPKRESEGKRYSPDVPKRESEGKRYNPDVPKRESEGKRYSSDVPKRESEGKRHSPDVPKMESEGKRYNPDLLKMETMGKRHSPDVPKRESEGKRHSPDVPKIELEGKRHSPVVPKIELEGKRHSPDVPKRESEGKRYSPDVPKMETMGKKHSPDVPKIELEGKRHSPVVPKIELEGKRHSPDVPKMESEGKRHSPDVPKMSAEAGPVALGKSLSSSKIVQGPQGTKMDDKAEFVFSKVGNIFRGDYCSGHQPQLTKILNISWTESAKKADENIPKAPCTRLAGRTPAGISDSPESQASSDFSCQVSREETFVSESSQSTQTPEPPKDVFPFSDKFTYKPLPIHDQSPSGAPMNAAAQVQQQEPWMPPQASGKGLNKDTPLSAKRLWSATQKTEELGTRVALPETIQPDGKSYHAQDSPSQGNLGKRPIPSLPVKALSPPEHQFRKHVKHFFQWLSPDRKSKGPEALLKKETFPSSSAQDRELKGKVTLPGSTVAQKVMRDFGKVPKEQPGQRHGVADTMRPRAPLSPPTKPVKTKPKKEYWFPADSVRGRQFQHQASLSKMPSPGYHNQAAAFLVQKRCVAERARQLQRCEALQPRPPVPHRESELRQNLLSRAGKVPRGTPPFAVGPMLADMSRLCEQKILAQNFSGRGFVPQK